MSFGKTIFAAVCTTVAFATAAPSGVAAAYPEKPIKVIVPTGAGGAMDGIARIFQRAFEEHKILSQRMVVVNMEGAGGTIGTRAIKDAEPDGYTIGLWHSGLVTSAAMGVTDYDHSAFSIIGSTGFATMGLAVKEGGPIESFKGMIEKSKAEPNSVKVAVNIGLPVHFIPLMVADKAGVEMRMVQVGGGAKRLASVMGGHTHVALFSVQEFLKYGPTGLKAINVFDRERHPLVPDVPTAAELGVPVFASDSRIWLAPKKVPQDRIDLLVKAFETAMGKSDVKERLEGFGINASFIDPVSLTQELDRTRAEVIPLVAKARALPK